MPVMRQLIAIAAVILGGIVAGLALVQYASVDMVRAFMSKLPGCW